MIGSEYSIEKSLEGSIHTDCGDLGPTTPAAVPASLTALSVLISLILTKSSLCLCYIVVPFLKMG